MGHVSVERIFKTWVGSVSDLLLVTELLLYSIFHFLQAVAESCIAV